jgi:hypothetical protein
MMKERCVSPDAPLLFWGLVSGGKGVYFGTSDGHLLELLTVPQ